MIFSERIKDLRMENNISQKSLSEKLGLSQSCVTKLENGLREPTGSTLIAYANYFNVSVDYLVGRDSDVRVISKNGNLTKNESEILRIFTILDEVQQNRVIGYAYALAR